MATQPPTEAPQPTQPAQPTPAPTELPPQSPDIDMPDPGADPSPTGPANPA